MGSINVCVNVTIQYMYIPNPIISHYHFILYFSFMDNRWRNSVACSSLWRGSPSAKWWITTAHLSL